MSASRFVSAVVGCVRCVEGVKATVYTPFDNCICRRLRYVSRRAEVGRDLRGGGWLVSEGFERLCT
eukprot:2454897-Prymnesium_polylepis.1